MSKNVSNQCTFRECEPHKFENFERNVKVKYKTLRGNSTRFPERERGRERESPWDFIKIWKDVFLRLILKKKDGNQDLYGN